MSENYHLVKEFAKDLKKKLDVSLVLEGYGTKAYSACFGPGIKMEVEGEERPLAVSVDNPERVCEILFDCEGPR